MTANLTVSFVVITGAGLQVLGKELATDFLKKKQQNWILSHRAWIAYRKAQTHGLVLEGLTLYQRSYASRPIYIIQCLSTDNKYAPVYKSIFIYFPYTIFLSP